MGLKILSMKSGMRKIIILFIMLASVSFGADLKINLKTFERYLLSKGYNGKYYEEPTYEASYYVRKNGVYEENVNIFSKNSKVYRIELDSRHYHARPNAAEIMENLESLVKDVKKNSQNEELNKFLDSCLKKIPQKEGISHFNEGKYASTILITRVGREITVEEQE